MARSNAASKRSTCPVMTGGLVMPTWRRYDYLKTCLNSLRQSQLKNTILCILDESDSEGLGELSNYRIFRYLDSWGYDLQCIAGSIEEIKVQCDRDPECVAFNSLGYLKYRIRPAREWITQKKILSLPSMSRNKPPPGFSVNRSHFLTAVPHPPSETSG